MLQARLSLLIELTVKVVHLFLLSVEFGRVGVDETAFVTMGAFAQGEQFVTEGTFGAIFCCRHHAGAEKISFAEQVFVRLTRWEFPSVFGVDLCVVFVILFLFSLCLCFCFSCCVGEVCLVADRIFSIILRSLLLLPDDSSPSESDVSSRLRLVPPMNVLFLSKKDNERGNSTIGCW